MTDSESSDAPKLHVDSDWKAQARAEKQKLQEQIASEAESGEGQPRQGEIPPADFKTLISSLVSQALLYMGAIPDPMTGQRIAHLELAQHNIDLLGVLEEKTKGNIDPDEEALLSQALRELRAHFTQLAQQVAAHQAHQAQQAAAGGPTGGAKPPSGGIIDPTKP